MNKENVAPFSVRHRHFLPVLLQHDSADVHKASEVLDLANVLVAE